MVFDTVFDVEINSTGGCYDYVQFYSSDNEFPMAGPFCGNQAPEAFSFSGEVMVHFHSDIFNRGKGFHAKYGPPGSNGDDGDHEEKSKCFLSYWNH